MIIPIDEKYQISPEKMGGWVIQEYKLISKDRNESKWVSICYPPTIEAAIKKLAHIKLCDSDVRTVADALKEIDRIAKVISNALEPALRLDLARLRA